MSDNGIGTSLTLLTGICAPFIVRHLRRLQLGNFSCQRFREFNSCLKSRLLVDFEGSTEPMQSTAESPVSAPDGQDAMGGGLGVGA
jgi:hypothetical protein